MKEINVSNKQIDNEACKSIAQIIENNKNINNIDISSNNIGDEGAIVISNVLKTYTHISIISLDIQNNKIGNKGVNSLFDTFNSNDKIQFVKCANQDNKDIINKFLETSSGSGRYRGFGCSKKK